jgi:hypothetical protein
MRSLNPFRSWRERVVSVAILALILVVAVFLNHTLFAHALGTGGALTAMVIIPWQPALTRGELDDLANPAQLGQAEVIPWELFDTQSLATATSAPLVFFQTINADKTLSNMEGPGQLPDPQYLVVHYAACDILQPAVSAAQAAEPNAAWANITNILETARATFTFNMSNKRYGPFKLTMCHATGGVTGSGYGYGTAAAGQGTAYGNNGIPGSGGYPWSGSLIIPPKIGFDVTLNFGTAVTLVGGPINIAISLVGALYRRVL